MKFYVTVAITSQHIMEVEAKDFESAKTAAENSFDNIDMNDVEYIDMEVTSAEAETGNKEYFD